MSIDNDRHRVAVIRVEVREPPERGLLIELLEVGRDRDADLLLGSATSADQLCTILRGWLAHLTEQPGTG